MKVLITGATGFLGSALAAALQPTHVVLCHGRQPLAGRESGTWITGDLTDPATYGPLTACGATVLIHTVALSHQDSEGPAQQVLATNVAPYLELLQRATAGSLRYVIYLSTTQVYGTALSGEVTEATPPCPANVYGATHLMAEQCGELMARRGAVRSVNLRLANAFGPPGHPAARCWHVALNDFCRMALRDRVIRLQSDGSASRDFVPLGLVTGIVQHLLAAADRWPRCQTLNVATGTTTTVRAAADRIAALATARLGQPVVVTTPAAPTAPPPSAPGWRFVTTALQPWCSSPAPTFDATVQDLFNHWMQHG